MPLLPIALGLALLFFLATRTSSGNTVPGPAPSPPSEGAEIWTWQAVPGVDLGPDVAHPVVTVRVGDLIVIGYEDDRAALTIDPGSFHYEGGNPHVGMQFRVAMSSYPGTLPTVTVSWPDGTAAHGTFRSYKGAVVPPAWG